jgi:hypothetical protein
METAAKVLVVGGVLNLALAFVLGFILSNSRLKEPAKTQPYLAVAHRVSLWEGFMLLGLVFAVELSDLSSGVETLAAVLLVASSAFQDGSSVLNWVQGVADEFAERSPGFYLATINAILATAGLGILIVGVFHAL